MKSYEYLNQRLPLSGVVLGDVAGVVLNRKMNLPKTKVFASTRSCIREVANCDELPSDARQLGCFTGGNYAAVKHGLFDYKYHIVACYPALGLK